MTHCTSDDLIHFCVEKGMEVAVTLIHYDTPLDFYANPTEQYDTAIGYRDGKYGDPDFQAGFYYYGKILMTHSPIESLFGSRKYP